MKIALLTDGIYPYVLGGMQKHSYFMAKYLARNNVEVDLFHCVSSAISIPEHQGADPKFFSRTELENIQFWCNHFPHEKNQLPGHYIRENKTYSKQLAAEVLSHESEYDIIYAQGFTGWELIRQRKLSRLKVPVIVNFHGLEMFQTPPSLKVRLQHLILKGLTRRNISNADYIVSFGGKISRIMEHLKVPKSRIIELPIGIESHWLTDSITHSNKIAARKFVFVGRYERRKGIEELNRALKILLEEESDLRFEFHFVGPIPENRRLIDSRLIYHGELRNEEQIIKIMSDSDILVCPSHSEGMPTVILEGMAQGLAIIATNVGAVEKLVNKNGWLLDEVDVNQLRKAILAATTAPSTELAEMQAKSLELVREKFLWEKVARDTIQALKGILE